MRACTAVVTEISYNHSKVYNYRAEVEYVSPSDWRKELTVLYSEVFENGSVSRDSANADSDAGIAYAKIRAVYNKYTNEMLAQSSIDALMENKNVSAVLGTTKRINAQDPSSFYDRLQHYVDSREKGPVKEFDKLGRKITKRKRDFESWPLIRVVRLYTRTEALETGAVIVDLPGQYTDQCLYIDAIQRTLTLTIGVSDSNAARAAVADAYIESCTGLWIVAPITCAVDDKVAKHLLGSTFKRQLKYDGTYSAVTFICSKTDDISRTEAAQSLKLDEFEELEERLHEIRGRKRTISKRLKELKAQKADFTAAGEQLDETIEAWDELKDDVEDGKTVYAPSTRTKKRKPDSQTGPASRKKRRSSLVDDSEDATYVAASSEEESVVDEEQNDDASVPLTEHDIADKLAELKQMKKDLRKQRNDTDAQTRETRDQLTAIDPKEVVIDARQNTICIDGRNGYSRGAIQQDFAAGIKELDMKTAEQENADTFNPDEDIRNYDDVARNLPVFCVSSRAYQKLLGRLQKDNDVPGFETPESTEIPAL